MTNEELKKKICKIIADNYLPKEMPDRLEDYKLYRFKRAAEALIAAGIGFMDDDITSQIVAIIKRDTEPITMENVALRKQVAEAEHRAERAERAFSKLVHEMYEHGIRPMCDEKFFTESRLKEAEKELADEGKDGKLE